MSKVVLEQSVAIPAGTPWYRLPSLDALPRTRIEGGLDVRHITKE